jgi:hypothetical protein
MKHQQFDEDMYFSRQPMKKQTEDEKPSKGRKPRKDNYQEQRNRKREQE